MTDLRFDDEVVVVADNGADIGVNAIPPRAYTRMSASQGQQLAQLYGMSEDMMTEIDAHMATGSVL